MPRNPRYLLPGVPCHVIQRGNNKQACFFCDADRDYYLSCLVEAAAKYRCAVHAYVLMTNHVHLLMSAEESQGVSLLMQSVGRRYVQYINRTQQRTGTLWEGRFKGSLIDSEAYLLTCYRYIELNPVRAGMVGSPGDYPWSSYAANAQGKSDPLVSPSDLYLRLGEAPAERCEAYAELCEQRIADERLDAIRGSVNRGQPLGSEWFRISVGNKLGLAVSDRKRGRPRKKSVDPMAEEREE